MNPVDPNRQIDFLVYLQRLLTEGSFTSTYKFALLLALADISVEKGDGTAAPLPITTTEIAEKFIFYYWRQAVPYVPLGGNQGQILRQNSDRQAAVVRHITEARNSFGPSLGSLHSNTIEWTKLRRRIAGIIEEMPLWRLQLLGTKVCDNLYPQVGSGSEIELRPGIAFCFRTFHDLTADLVQGAWLRFVRKVQANQTCLGEQDGQTPFPPASQPPARTPRASYFARFQMGVYL